MKKKRKRSRSKLYAVFLMLPVLLLYSSNCFAAASDYSYKVFSTKTYMSDYVKGAEITVRNSGNSIFDTYDGIVYNYLASENHSYEVTITTRVDFEKLTNDGTNSIYFSDDSCGFVYDVYGSIGFMCDTSYTDRNVQNLNMYLQDIRMNIYGKSYDIPYNSNTGFIQDGEEIWVPIGTLIYVDDIPNTKRLSTNDVEIQATFLVTFTQTDHSYEDKVIVQPKMRYFVDGLRFYELYDYLEPLLNRTNNLLQNMRDHIITTENKLKELFDFLDPLLTRTNNLLQNIRDHVIPIHNLLDDVVNSTESDEAILDDFDESSNSQSSQLGQLTQDSQVQKIDINSASSTVDSNIDMNSVGDYGVLLSALTNNKRVGQMILIALSVSLVSYIFFGKR